jgi:hypothetical protein
MEPALLCRAVSRWTIKSPARPLLSRTPVLQILHTQRRLKATRARTKRALNLPPHPDFVPDTAAQGDVVIFNPPSSEASVYHTPFKFLPKSDPRRRANIVELFKRSGAVSRGSDAPLLPARLQVKPAPPQKLATAEDVAEMRRLRLENPAAWSVRKLAARFGCPLTFVMAATQAPQEHLAAQKERLEALKTRWGPMKAQAKLDRKKRMEMLVRGEI